MLSIPAMPEDEKTFGRYTVTLNGQPAPVWQARVSAMPYNTPWPGHQRPLAQTELAGFCLFRGDEPVEVRVTVEQPFQNVRIRPLSAGILPEINGREIAFCLPHPGQYTVEPDGFHGALHLFQDSCRNEAFPEENIIRFPAGVHRIGTMFLRSNQTVVLEEGAVVYGSVVGCGVRNVTVTGCGILDGSLEQRTDDTPLLLVRETRSTSNNPAPDFSQMDGPALENLIRERHILNGCLRFYNCENVTVSHITCRDSASFTILPQNCENVRIDEVKIIGNWRYNSDGVDFCNSRNCVLRNSFLRDFDDCVAAKGMSGWGHRAVRNILVERCVVWCDWGRSLEIGAETNADEYCQLLFRDCDIIHGSWTYLDIQHHNDAEIRDITFENIRCELSRGRLPEKLQRTDDAPYRPNGTEPAQPPLIEAIFKNCGLYGAGHSGQCIRNIVYRDIREMSDVDEPEAECRFCGLNEENAVRGVLLDGICRNGRRLTTPEDAGLLCGEYAYDVTLR